MVAEVGSLEETHSHAVHVGFDMAILDLGLPDGNGADLIGALREVNPDAAVLVLSASLDPTNLARAKEVGADEIRGDRKYLLAELVKYAVCGYACVGHTAPARGKKYHYYACIDGRTEKLRMGPPPLSFLKRWVAGGARLGQREKVLEEPWRGSRACP